MYKLFNNPNGKSHIASEDSLKTLCGKPVANYSDYSYIMSMASVNEDTLCKLCFNKASEPATATFKGTVVEISDTPPDFDDTPAVGEKI